MPAPCGAGGLSLEEKRAGGGVWVCFHPTIESFGVAAFQLIHEPTANRGDVGIFVGVG